MKKQESVIAVRKKKIVNRNRPKDNASVEVHKCFNITVINIVNNLDKMSNIMSKEVENFRTDIKTKKS